MGVGHTDLGVDGASIGPTSSEGDSDSGLASPELTPDQNEIATCSQCVQANFNP